MTNDALNDADFQSLQTRIVELLKENYDLSDRLRRDKAISENRISVLEDIIEKSNKISSMASVLNQNKSLTRKLESQEQEFRLQNETLLEEYGKIVTEKKNLEKRIKEIINPQNTSDDYNNANHPNLSDELLNLQEQLKRKIEAFKNLHKEKEIEFSKFNEQIDSVVKEKNEIHEEILSLKEQLKVGHGAFEEFKNKKNKEIYELQKQIQNGYETSRLLEFERTQIINNELNCSLEDKNRQIEESLKENEGLKRDLVKNEKNHCRILKERNQMIDSLERKLRDSETEKEKMEKCVLMTEESARERMSQMNQIQNEAEKEMKELENRSKDLEMQLEISNAQLFEFEEQVRQLKIDVSDALEEKKIAEKKGLVLIKDLKRQLLAEKNLNEKLSEKIKEETSSHFNEADSELDRHSISSWSIMSKDDHSSPRNASTPLPDDDKLSIDDQKELLTKITSLQELYNNTYERVRMLENSSAAMADDLVKKSNLIQFYCMNSKAGRNQSKAVSCEQNTVYRLMNKIKSNFEDDETSNPELKRMQKILEETLTKNMHLTKDLEVLSLELVHLSKRRN